MEGLQIIYIYKKKGIILKVSFQETFSIISIHSGKFRIYAKGVSSRDTFHERKKKSIS